MQKEYFRKVTIVVAGLHGWLRRLAEAYCSEASPVAWPLRCLLLGSEKKRA